MKGKKVIGKKKEKERKRNKKIKMKGKIRQMNEG